MTRRKIHGAGPARQGGWTIWSLMLGCGLIVFCAYIGLKLFPPYFDAYKIRQALDSLSADPRVTLMSRNQMVSELSAKLYVDYVDKVVDIRKTLKVTKEDKELVLNFDYVRREHLFLNITVIMDFRNEVRIPRP